MAPTVVPAASASASAAGRSRRTTLPSAVLLAALLLHGSGNLISPTNAAVVSVSDCMRVELIEPSSSTKRYRKRGRGRGRRERRLSGSGWGGGSGSGSGSGGGGGGGRYYGNVAAAKTPRYNGGGYYGGYEYQEEDEYHDYVYEEEEEGDYDGIAYVKDAIYDDYVEVELWNEFLNDDNDGYDNNAFAISYRERGGDSHENGCDIERGVRLGDMIGTYSLMCVDGTASMYVKALTRRQVRTRANYFKVKYGQCDRIDLYDAMVKVEVDCGRGCTAAEDADATEVAAKVAVAATTTAPGWWKPNQYDTWDWQLKRSSLDYDRDVDVYDVDLFDYTAADIYDIKTKGGEYANEPGKWRRVVCYFSSGSWENWREDASDFPDEVKGSTYYGFKDERWLDVRNTAVLHPIMSRRLDMARSKGCDAVEPDNMDVYDDTAHEYSGFDVQYDDQIEYNKWLAAEAHNRGMGCALKNDVGQAYDLEPYFDFVVSEQCVQYDECHHFRAFINAGKAVFLCEYELTLEEFCPTATGSRLMGILKNVDLGSEKYEACRPPWWTGAGLDNLKNPAAAVSQVIIDTSLTFTLDVDRGLAGRAITLSATDSSDFGTTQGRVIWDEFDCPVTYWSPKVVKAYISDDADPRRNSVRIETTEDGGNRVSPSVEFMVLVPTINPTDTLRDAFRFVRDRMRNGEGGVHTNLLDRNVENEIYLYGHHVTSEHMGLFMRCAAAILDHRAFERSYQYVLTKMVDPQYDVVNWGVDKNTGGPYTIGDERKLQFNAPLDDFRVVKALLAGWVQWGDDRYRDLALRIGRGNYAHSVSGEVSQMYPNGLVTTGCAWEDGGGITTETEIVPINYADLWTMDCLGRYSDADRAMWEPVVVESVELMKAAQLPNGQFYNTFRGDGYTFAGDFEYQDDEMRRNKIKTIQSMWTAIHLARTGHVDEARRAFNFYKGWYNIYGRIPEYLNPNGSETTLKGILKNGEVRIYAQLVRLADALDDIKFRDTVAQEKIVPSQDRRDVNSPTFGRLGVFPNSDDAEAYESLEGALGLATVEGSNVMRDECPF